MFGSSKELGVARGKKELGERKRNDVVLQACAWLRMYERSFRTFARQMEQFSNLRGEEEER